MFTQLENQFLDAMEREAYGGLLFVNDVAKQAGLEGKIVSGIVSSLNKKGVIASGADGMISINDEYELSEEDVKVIRKDA